MLKSPINVFVLTEKKDCRMPRTIVALVLFSAITSAVMSAIVCGVMTYQLAGMTASFAHIWLGGWVTAWPVAFIVMLSIGPLIRKQVYKACKCPLNAAVEPQPTDILNAQD